MSTQSLTALARAQQLRTGAQAISREIARVTYPEGKGIVADMLRHPTETAARMRVHRLLTSIRGIGDRKAVEILDQAGLTRGAYTRRVGPTELDELTLSERQRLALARVLER